MSITISNQFLTKGGTTHLQLFVKLKTSTDITLVLYRTPVVLLLEEVNQKLTLKRLISSTSFGQEHTFTRQ